MFAGVVILKTISLVHESIAINGLGCYYRRTFAEIILCYFLHLEVPCFALLATIAVSETHSHLFCVFHDEGIRVITFEARELAVRALCLFAKSCLVDGETAFAESAY